MSDNETFDEFYAKLNDIVNYTFNFGEVYDQPKVVRKIPRYLTEDFRPKVTAIIESKDVDTIPVDELIGSLQSYKSDLPKTNKSKSMALKSVDNLDDCGFDDKSLLQRLLILPRTLETFWGTIIEGQEIEIMLALRVWRKMKQPKIIFLKN